MVLEWWVWIVGGIALVLLELAIPSFFVIWFGLGALLVGLLLLIAPGLPLSGQLLLWAASSTVMTVLWFRYFKRFTNQTPIGTADGDVIGEIGLLVHAVAPFTRGKVRFQRPILGAEEWPCAADAEIDIGTRVKVVSVEGSFVKVEKA
ncbi:MAG: NfeD family protein [Azoarcus sp.]|jgi:membrane protein implicated in regulation of membrane protease activity|nr:NfeD family protein [Azoarcus sp.]